MTVEPLSAQRRWPFRNTGTQAAVGPAAIVMPNPFVKCLRYPHRSDARDWLGVEDRAALHQALKDSDEDVKAGRLVDANVILRELKSR